MDMSEKYFVTTTPIEPKDGVWGQLNVDIYQHIGNEDHWIGHYIRNYYNLLHTFLPFMHHSKEYALYSPNYTATRVMELPSCNDICGEEPDSNGFCPVDFYVPYNPDMKINGDFGFVSGCIWGDDGAWKIQLLDLSQIKNHIITRTDHLGYFEQPDGYRLADCISIPEHFDETKSVKIINQSFLKL